MKVILLEDVKSLGKKGEVVNVSDGYARNFVIPKKLGLEANGKNLNDLKLQKANEERIAKELLEAAEKFAAEMETKEVIVSIKSGEGGRTFGSVSSKEIAEAAKVQCGMEIDKKKIQLPEAIKNLGVYEVSVKLHQTTEKAGRPPAHTAHDRPSAYSLRPGRYFRSGRESRNQPCPYIKRRETNENPPVCRFRMA